MNKENWKKSRFYMISSMFLLLLAVAAAALSIRTAAGEYHDKMQIIGIMMNEDTKIDGAVRILKGQEELIRKGNEKLEEFGYFMDSPNALSIRYRNLCRKIIIVVSVGYFVSLFFIWILYGQEKKSRKRGTEGLCYVLDSYRRECFLVQDVQHNLSLARKNPELEHIGWALGEFGDYLKLLQARVKTEREETKSLVTDISHQLKTPVAALKTSFEILNREGLTLGEQQEFVQRCSIQLQGIEELLSALINISRMETGMIEIRQEPEKIFETMLEAVNRLYTRAGEKFIQIEMEGSEQLEDLIIPHDRKWLGEALINVLENAIKYSPPHTGIIIRLMERTSFLRIEIEDQGMGIPREEYHKIFKRFYRGKAAGQSGEPGSGVGLYLSREIIGRHGGMIRVSSGQKRAGSMFVIHLPYCLSGN